MKNLQDDYRQRLEAGDSVSRPQPPRPNARLENEWKAFSKPDIHAPVETAYPAKDLTRLGAKIFTPPADFTPHPIVEKCWRRAWK